MKLFHSISYGILRFLKIHDFHNFETSFARDQFAHDQFAH